jgi:hypothetical protein
LKRGHDCPGAEIHFGVRLAELIKVRVPNAAFTQRAARPQLDRFDRG